jgi:hypothetical protein
MATSKGQIPLGFGLTGKDGFVTQPWAFWLQTLAPGGGLPNTGYVLDGTSTIPGATTIFQDVLSNRRTGASQNIFFSKDTGAIYTVNTVGDWQLQSPEYIGDVTKPAFSNELSLKNVLSTPGIFGDSANIPVLTVDAKGRITAITTAPSTGGGLRPTPDVPLYDIYNALIGYATATAPVGEASHFVELTTIDNGSTGFARLTPGEGMVQGLLDPLGVIIGYIFPALSGNTVGVPYFINYADTFTVPVNYQALFELEIDVEGYLEVDGYLIQNTDSPGDTGIVPTPDILLTDIYGVPFGYSTIVVPLYEVALFNELNLVGGGGSGYVRTAAGEGMSHAIIDLIGGLVGYAFAVTPIIPGGSIGVKDLIDTTEILEILPRYQYIVTRQLEVLGQIINNGSIVIL